MAAVQEHTDKKEGKIRRRNTSIKIDMTPMVDLAFLLLTFFVLTTTLSKSYIMPIAMPEKTDEPSPISEKRVLTLMLGSNNKIFWYQGYSDQPVLKTNFSVDGVRKLLREKSAQIKNLVVFIKASNTSKYKNMVDILDEMVISSIAQYTIVDITDEEEHRIAKLN